MNAVVFLFLALLCEVLEADWDDGESIKGR